MRARNTARCHLPEKRADRYWRRSPVPRAPPTPVTGARHPVVNLPAVRKWADSIGITLLQNKNLKYRDIAFRLVGESSGSPFIFPSAHFTSINPYPLHQVSYLSPRIGRLSALCVPRAWLFRLETPDIRIGLSRRRHTRLDIVESDDRASFSALIHNRTELCRDCAPVVKEADITLDRYGVHRYGQWAYRCYLTSSPRD
ncbi:hypothetical protein EVAR_54856_1 [Eumeta japonica]|uniref:Uncharacterized protein n=1 Tax=Eumeta variegata TaxID=151549 RepID=A0A4C1YFP4_EUMVA|nr:hypothetical protein EVAR_54856_1 [Eumeta japonica]